MSAIGGGILFGSGGAAAAPSANSYLLACGFDASIETLRLFITSDGLSFRDLYAGQITVTGLDASETIRDPDIIAHGGRFYIAYTRSGGVHGLGGEQGNIGVLVSDDLKGWSLYTHIHVPAILTDPGKIWAPKWFTDVDGSIHLIASVSYSPYTLFAPYVAHALTDDFRQWSAFTAIGTDIGASSAIDYFLLRVGATYHLFFQLETGTLITHADSTSPWTGYVSDSDGPVDLHGEGPCVAIINGVYRLYVDQQDETPAYAVPRYVESTDLATWGAPQSASLVGSASTLVSLKHLAVNTLTDIKAFTAAESAWHADERQLGVVYGAGTAYALTNTSALLNLGTTPLSVVLPSRGTWKISATVMLKAIAATTAAETVALKLRRTNNTAADLTGGALAAGTLPAMTTTNVTIGQYKLPTILYKTTNDDDVIEVWGSLSAALSAGDIKCTSGEILYEKVG